ncbi:MAG: hypothetical protein IT279_02840 [Ignavibacteriaceae bacterium]|nr:hypothetical protein [Ignavibacteriaceae bacterium]
MFLLKELIKSVRYTSTGFVFSILTSIFGLLLLYVTLVGMQVPELLSEKLSHSFKMTLFLKDGLTEPEITELQNQISNEDFIAHAEFLSKSDAAKLFKNKTGEEFGVILSENPLPASFRLTLLSGTDPAQIEMIRGVLQKFPGVEEAVFEGELYLMLYTIIQKINRLLPYLTILLLIAAFYLNYSTTSLSLEKRRVETSIMMLVGATTGKIRTPVIFYSLLIAILSSVSSGLLIYLAGRYAEGRIEFLPPGFLLSYDVLSVWAASGLGIGLLSGLLCSAKVKLR